MIWKLLGFFGTPYSRYWNKQLSSFYSPFWRPACVPVKVIWWTNLVPVKLIKTTARNTDLCINFQYMQQCTALNLSQIFLKIVFLQSLNGNRSHGNKKIASKKTRRGIQQGPRCFNRSPRFENQSCSLGLIGRKEYVRNLAILPIRILIILSEQLLLVSLIKIWTKPDCRLVLCHAEFKYVVYFTDDISIKCWFFH